MRKGMFGSVLSFSQLAVACALVLQAGCLQITEGGGTMLSTSMDPHDPCAAAGAVLGPLKSLCFCPSGAEPTGDCKLSSMADFTGSSWFEKVKAKKFGHGSGNGAGCCCRGAVHGCVEGFDQQPSSGSKKDLARRPLARPHSPAHVPRGFEGREGGYPGYQAPPADTVLQNPGGTWGLGTGALDTEPETLPEEPERKDAGQGRGRKGAGKGAQGGLRPNTGNENCEHKAPTEGLGGGQDRVLFRQVQASSLHTAGSGGKIIEKNMYGNARFWNISAADDLEEPMGDRLTEEQFNLVNEHRRERGLGEEDLCVKAYVGFSCGKKEKGYIGHWTGPNLHDKNGQHFVDVGGLKGVGCGLVGSAWGKGVSTLNGLHSMTSGYVGLGGKTTMDLCDICCPVGTHPHDVKADHVYDPDAVCTAYVMDNIKLDAIQVKAKYKELVRKGGSMRKST